MEKTPLTNCFPKGDFLKEDLKEDEVLIPAVYWQAQGKTVNHSVPENPYLWVSATTADILEKKDYLGYTVNFKTYRQSW